jgi:hypothetical protein
MEFTSLFLLHGELLFVPNLEQKNNSVSLWRNSIKIRAQSNSATPY